MTRYIPEVKKLPTHVLTFSCGHKKNIIVGEFDEYCPDCKADKQPRGLKPVI